MPFIQAAKRLVAFFTICPERFVLFEPNFIATFEQTVFVAAKVGYFGDPKDSIKRNVFVVYVAKYAGHLFMSRES